VNGAVAVPPELAPLVTDGSGCAIVGAGEQAAVAFAWDPAGCAPAQVNWCASAGEGERGERLIAPAGSGLWRRAPLPAADALFELDQAERRVLVVGRAGTDELAESLAARSVGVTAVERLKRDLLAAAACVVMPGAPGEPLPAEAPAVLAAGRILVTTPRPPAFGLRPGIDHCLGQTRNDLVDLAEAVIRHRDAFAAMRAYARVAAERHRASRVLRDLMVDLELGL
jgi:hypothetical protein